MAARPNRGSAQGARQRMAGGSAPDRNNLYRLLNVPNTASSADITTSYRAAMKRFHPDRVHPDHREAAEDLCKDLNRAYKTLSNPAERLAYDRSIRAQVVQDQFMQRYTGEFGGPRQARPDPHATRLKRQITYAERQDYRRSERSAFVSLLSVFLVVALGGIGLILVGGLLSFLFQLVFS